MLSQFDSPEADVRQSLGWEILVRNQLLGKERRRSRNEQKEKANCNVGSTKPWPAWGSGGVVGWLWSDSGQSQGPWVMQKWLGPACLTQ